MNIKKKRKNKREMLSYEDKPIEEYERDREIKKRKKLPKFKNKKVRNVLIIGIILVLVVGIAAVWRFVSPDSLIGSIFSSQVKGEGFPVKIKGKSVNASDVCVLNNNIAYISETQFQVINASGGVTVDKRIKYSSPAMKSCKNYSIIYDRQGSGYEIQSASGTVYEGNMEDIIFQAVIIDNGCYAILSKKDGYTSKLTVFNKDNTKKYAYYFSECYAVSISLNHDATKAVVCGLDANEGSIVSKVYIIDFSNDKPESKIDFSNVTIYSAAFFDNGNVAIVGDKSAMVVTSDYKNKYEFTYNGYNLISKEITQSNMVLSLSPFEDGKSCELWNISQNGFVTQTKTGLATVAVDIFGNKAAVLADNKVSVFDIKKEKLLNEYRVGLDSKGITFSDEKNIYVLGTSEISALKIK